MCTVDDYILYTENHPPTVQLWSQPDRHGSNSVTVAQSLIVNVWLIAQQLLQSEQTRLAHSYHRDEVSVGPILN